MSPQAGPKELERSGLEKAGSHTQHQIGFTDGTPYVNVDLEQARGLRQWLVIIDEEPIALQNAGTAQPTAAALAMVLAAQVKELSLYRQC